MQPKRTKTSPVCTVLYIDSDATKDYNNRKSCKKIRVCHNLATWRCIFAAQLKNYEYEYRFECKRRSAVDADSVD